MHPEHDPRLQKTDNANDAIKTDDYTCEETKIADLPMENQEVAESSEQERDTARPERRSADDSKAPRLLRTRNQALTFHGPGNNKIV